MLQESEAEIYGSTKGGWPLIRAKQPREIAGRRPCVIGLRLYPNYSSGRRRACKIARGTGAGYARRRCFAVSDSTV